jgi:hypothetical protein
MLINGWHSDKMRERYLHIIGPLVITLVAMVIAVSTLSTGARYAAMMLMPASFYSAAIVILSWITGSIAQPRVKRAVAISFINAVCNTPNVSILNFQHLSSAKLIYSATDLVQLPLQRATALRHGFWRQRRSGNPSHRFRYSHTALPCQAEPQNGPGIGYGKEWTNGQAAG